jgi:hypothetical protein
VLHVPREPRRGEQPLDERRTLVRIGVVEKRAGRGGVGNRAVQIEVGPAEKIGVGGNRSRLYSSLFYF